MTCPLFTLQRLGRRAADTEEKAKKEAEEKARLAAEEKQRALEAETQAAGAAGKADKKTSGDAQTQVNGARPNKSDNSRGKNSKAEKSSGEKRQNGEWSRPPGDSSFRGISDVMGGGCGQPRPPMRTAHRPGLPGRQAAADPASLGRGPLGIPAEAGPGHSSGGDLFPWARSCCCGGNQCLPAPWGNDRERSQRIPEC